MNGQIIKLPAVTSEISLSGEWLAQRDELVKQAGEFGTISNNATMESAGDLLKKITRSSNELESIRLELTRPFNEAAKTIKAAADKAREPLEKSKADLQRTMTAYAVEQQRLADEARRKAEAEARRLAEEAAAKQQREYEEAQKRAEEERAKQQDMIDAGILDQCDAKEIEVAEPEQITIPEPVVPVVAVPTAGASNIRKVLVWDLTDLEKVSPMFMTFDEKKVNAWVKLNGDRIKAAIEKNDNKPVEFSPGITFRLETKVQAGR